MNRSLSYRLSCLVFFLSLVAAPHATFAEISQHQRDETYRQLEIFAHVLSILQENYIDEIDPVTSMEGAINGLLLSLDPHSSFLTAEDFRELQDETQGSFSGIGIEVTVKEGLLTIIAPIEGTPGDKAGLQAKDLIMRINGELTSEMTPKEAIKKLRGPKGSTLSISIFREEWNEIRDFEITRDFISLQSVKGNLLAPGMGYVRITNFQSHTTKDLKQKLITFEKEGPLKGLIIDLRNNPGGLLNQAVSIADLFLDEGLIVFTKGRSKDQNLTFSAIDTDANYDFPLIVLVNEGSASASEIVSGALQDHKRGIVVGTNTFGKGSIQTIIPLANGTGLKMTTARYYTPKGNSIQEQGIHPDVLVKRISVKNETEGKESPLAAREKDLKNHLNNQNGDQLKAREYLHPEIRRQLESDNQLNTAYNILKSLRLYAKYGTESPIQPTKK